MMDYYIVLTCAVLACVSYTDAACTMPEVFRGSSWNDNAKGLITISTWKMSGWAFDVDGQIVSDWEVVDNVNFDEKGYLALRSVQTFDVSNTTYYSYVCMKFERISNSVHKYFTPHALNPMADNQNVLTADHDDLTRFDEICDEQFTIDQKLFNVFVKDGQAPSFTCPNPILTTAELTVELANTTVVCGNTDWEGCSNKRTLQLNNTCSHPIAYSGSGRLNCITSKKEGDTTSVILMNRDETVDDVNTFRFACVMVKEDGTSMVISPKECYPSQTYSDFPNNRKGVKVGQKITTTTISSDCRIVPEEDDDDEILSVPAIVGIVLGGLVLIILILVVLYCCCKYRNH